MNRKPEPGTANRKPIPKVHIPDPARVRGGPKEFPSATHLPTIGFYFSRIPDGLWSKVRAKAEREGVSMRTLLLRLLTAWLAEPPRRRV